MAGAHVCHLQACKEDKLRPGCQLAPRPRRLHGTGEQRKRWPYFDGPLDCLRVGVLAVWPQKGAMGVPWLQKGITCKETATVAAGLLWVVKAFLKLSVLLTK